MNAETKLHSAICNAVILLNNGEEIAPCVSTILRTALSEYVSTPDTPAPDPSASVEIMEALMAKLYAVAQEYNDRSCDYDVCKEVRDAVSYIQQYAAPAAAVGGDPCVICSADEPYTGTCGSNDRRALCNQRRTPAAPVGGFVVVGKITGIAQLTGLYEIDWTDEGHKLPGTGVGMSIYAPAAQPSAKDGAVSDVWEAYKTWPEDIRAKLSCHDLRRMSGWAPTPNPDDWRIDTSAGGPILVYQNCSVIQDEQARYVLGLISKDAAQMGDIPLMKCICTSEGEGCTNRCDRGQLPPIPAMKVTIPSATDSAKDGVRGELSRQSEAVAFVDADELRRFKSGCGGPFIYAGVENEIRSVPLYEAAEPTAYGEAVAFLHIVSGDDGEQDQALSFTADSFPLEGVAGYRKLSCEPLFAAPQAGQATTASGLVDDASVERLFGIYKAAHIAEFERLEPLTRNDREDRWQNNTDAAIKVGLRAVLEAAIGREVGSNG